MHKPVLLKQILEYLEPCPGKDFIDCTFGFGGHSLALLEKNRPDGKVLGIEQDKKVLQRIKVRPFERDLASQDHYSQDQTLRTVLENKRLTLVNDNFNNLKEIVKEYEFNRVNGILFDLGVSSWHFDQSGRGFSFQIDESLDMRLGSVTSKLTAGEIVNQWSEQELDKIFKEYGQERYARLIAEAIVRQRKIQPIKTTKQLVEIISQVVPKKYQHGRTHFATRIFQALRIAVNDELNNLEKALPQALKILEKNGRLVVVSFHSLEDRIVKNFFRESAKKGEMEILTKKPIVPSHEEIKLNPRSRSAKLRAVVKL